MDEVGGGMGTYKRRKFGETQATENTNCALFSPMMTVGRKKKRTLDHNDGRESEIEGLRSENTR
jgi:hypothetical protein